MENNIIDVYDRFYDDQSKRPNAKLLGKFEFIEQIMEWDAWSEMFVGRNIDTDEVCIIKGDEVCGFESGTRYTIYPLKNVYAKN